MAWIRTDDPSKRPEQGKFYWITMSLTGGDCVRAAKWGRKYWSFDNGERIRAKVSAWWDRPVFIPNPYRKPARTEKPKGSAETGLNVLADEEMLRIGFSDSVPNRWTYRQRLSAGGGGMEFSLSASASDPSDCLMGVIDSQSRRPYDYEERLRTNPDDGDAEAVAEEVSGILKYLRLSGALRA